MQRNVKAEFTFIAINKETKEVTTISRYGTSRLDAWNQLQKTTIPFEIKWNT